MQTLEQKLLASQEAYQTVMIPMLQEMVGALFISLDIQDRVATSFPALNCQCKDLKRIIEYHFDAGVPIFTNEGTELSVEETAAIIKNLTEILNRS